MFKTFGIFAHVDVGKTTLSEQILYQMNCIRKTGRVDDGSAFLDSSEIERRRGITIYSDTASFQLDDDTYYLIDTPGHTDFQAACERVIAVLDFAVLVVSAVEGVQAHTMDLWELLAQAQVPVWIFVNKTDRSNADVPSVLAQISSLTDGKSVQLTQELDETHYGEAQNDLVMQRIVEQDEGLLEQYLSETGEVPYVDFCRQFTRLMKAGTLIPVIAGCALDGTQVEVLLKNIHRFTETEYREEVSRNKPFSARAFRVQHLKDGTRAVYLKCLTGQLRPREILGNEKVHQIFAVNGPKLSPAECCSAGMVCVVTGLNKVQSDAWIAADAGVSDVSDMAAGQSNPPVILAGVQFGSGVSDIKVLDVLRLIADEEPSIQVQRLSEAGQIQVAVNGKIQLEVIRELCSARYGLEIEWGKCAVVYRETIAKPVVGCGHYEPLRHYAEVHLLLEPGERGSGITFESQCPLEMLGLNWQRLIETHVFEKKHVGVLTGSALTDVKVTLLAGRAHLKHTEGGDFREAVYRAIRQGLRSTDSILLEPCYRVELTAPQEYVNRMISDMVKKCGSYETPVPVGEEISPDGVKEFMVMLAGRVPVSECLDYYEEFMSYMKGRGRMRLRFGGYEECHNMPQVIEELGYDAERDYENTADSVFCSHGAGYAVKWQEAPEKMHIAVRSCEINGSYV